MNKSPDKISVNTTPVNPKELLKEGLDNIIIKDKLVINPDLMKTFDILNKSANLEKLKNYANVDGRDPISLFLLSVITDLIEENQSIQDDLFQISEAYEDVVALITHEFKNILTSVHGYNMMMDRELKKREIRDLREVLKSSDRLTRQLFDMSDSLLRMSLGEKGLLTPEYKLINIVHDILLPIEKDLQDVVHEKNMNITINKPSGDLIIEADDGLLDIVLRNLLINAIRYGKDGSDIMISIDRINKDCIIMVKNECENIPEKFCENIFKKFTTKKVGNVKGGTGLGLYNVKKIIDLHHGTVKCNVRRNNWIEFKITLPQNIL